LGPEANHSSPSSAEVNSLWIYTFPPHLHDEVLN
jgi:hypothetical protein